MSTEHELREQLQAMTHERNVLASGLIAAESDHATAVQALRELIESIEYLPLGLRSLKALHAARRIAYPASAKTEPRNFSEEAKMPREDADTLMKILQEVAYTLRLVPRGCAVSVQLLRILRDQHDAVLSARAKILGPALSNKDIG